MNMANKTVDLNPQAYELLLKLQKKGESISDTIIRLAAKPSIENGVVPGGFSMKLIKPAAPPGIYPRLV